MKTSYVVIISTEDGISIEEICQKVLLERIEENYWGNISWLDEIPLERDPNYWGVSGIIIKNGEVVVPKPETVVTKWSV